MALVGNIRDFGLSEFLYLVDRGHKTGRLKLQKPDDSAELYFKDGKLVYATHYNQPERLGDMLVRTGRISPEQLHAALKLQHSIEQGKPIGAILISRNMITLDEIQRCVRSQIEEITYSLFAWTEGDFRFEPDVAPPPESMPIPLSIENVIMEGTRRIDEWARIKDRIPSLDVVVRFTDQPYDKAKGVNLTPDEWRVFARINGVHSIRQIAQQTQLGEFDVARIVYGFLSAGLVMLTKQAPPPDQRGTVGTGTRPLQNNMGAVPPQSPNQPMGANGARQMPPRSPNGAGVAAMNNVQQPRYKKSFIQKIIDAVIRR
jgi:Domain of unknown function (DUF4388)